MAGIFFWNREEVIDEVQVEHTFNELGYKKGFKYSYNDWNFVVFPKFKYTIANYYEQENEFICCVGTFGYKGKVYNECLIDILRDYKNNNIDVSSFWGSFIIILCIDNKINIIRDSTILTRLFKINNKNIYSTSFSSLIDLSPDKVTLDKESVTELITTGILTLDQTIISDIKVVDKNSNLANIAVKYIYNNNASKPKNRDQAIMLVQKNLVNYYTKMINSFNNYLSKPVIDIGITAGIDSRLNVILAKNISDNIVLHTHYRNKKNRDKDYEYAKIFSQASGIPININKNVITAFEMSAKDLEMNFQESYNLCDGIIRAGCYWDEQYSTQKYRLSLEKRDYLRLLGFGGELFRNRERIPLKKGLSLKKWIRWQMLYSFAGRYFKCEKDAVRLEERIEKNLKVQFSTDQFDMNLENFKRYLVEVESVSYRSIQSSIENRLGFCVNPYSDQSVIFPALLSSKFLGKSLTFQLDIMKNISYKLARIPNGYGFDFTKKEPIKYRLLSSIWQILPTIKYKVYSWKKNNFSSPYINKLAEKHNFIQELIVLVEDLNLSVDLEKHLTYKSRSRLILNLGYFLMRNKDKLIIKDN